MKIFCLIYHNDGLLPFWLRYYAKHEPHLIVHTNVTDHELASAGVGVGCSVYRFNDDYEGGIVDSQRTMAIVHRVMQVGEWYMVADLDEFHVFEPPSKGALAVRTRFVDRVAQDGKLHTIDQSRSLDEQFPLRFNASGIVPPICQDKVAALQYPVTFSAGHHSCDTRLYSDRVGETHHFKWHGQLLVPWLQKRSKIPFYKSAFESDLFLQHIAKFGGIDISDPTLEVHQATSIGA